MRILKFRHPVFCHLLGFVFFLLLRLWTKTLRYRFAFLDGRHHPTPVKRDRFIYAFWHELIFVPTAIRVDIHVLISKHRDGEWLAQICRRLGCGIVRGSTQRNGSGALRQLLAKSEQTHLAITPDGPRGPRRRVQSGLIYLASRSGLPIIPCGVGLAHSWHLKSWDRFSVPMPFSGVTIVYGAPIHIPANLNRSQLEEYRKVVEQELAKVTTTAQIWAERKRSKLFQKLARSVRKQIARVFRLFEVEPIARREPTGTE